MRPSYLRDRPRVLPARGPQDTRSRLSLAEAQRLDGDPWFREKELADRGEAGHPHFSGLVAEGNFRHDVLAAHNAVRSRGGMPHLAWSDKLESLATGRAEKLVADDCNFEHSPLRDRWLEAGFQYVGENLYKVINMRPTGVDVVDAWYAEIFDYTYGNVGSSCTTARCEQRVSPPCAVGHFTQVMWQESAELGCARAACPSTARETFIVVCHYGEGGNVVGHMPFSRRVAASLGMPQEACDDLPLRPPRAGGSRAVPDAAIAVWFVLCAFRQLLV